MGLELSTLRAFSDELRKLAHEVTDDLEAVHKQMKAGDILVTTPRKEFYDAQDRITRLRMRALRWFQGTPYTHTSMYGGDGKILEIGTWHRGGERKSSVTSAPIEQWAKRYNFRVLRVDATPKERQEAVEFMHSQKGKPYDYGTTARLMLPVSEVDPKVRAQEYENKETREPKKVICSQLVAAAYPNQHFSKRRPLRFVRPVDIQKSPLTSIVMEYRGGEAALVKEKQKQAG